MPASINFIGRLGRDPELRYTPSNQAVCSVSVAVSNGKNNPADWYRLTIWGKQGEIFNQYLRKGSQVFVTGTFQMREFEDKDGNKRMSPDVNVTSFEMVGGRQDGGDTGGAAVMPSDDPATAAVNASLNVEEDEVPF